MDVLLGTGLGEIERLVKRHGEFYPFGLVWKSSTELPEIVMVLEDAEEEFPDSAGLLERVWEVLRGRRDEIEAAAVVSDIYLEGRSAGAVALEHRLGITFTVVQFYGRKRLGRGFKVEELSGLLSEPRIWD